MVSIDEDLVHKLLVSPNVDLVRIARGLRDGDMIQADYLDFVLILDEILEKSFGEGYKTSHLMPIRHECRERTYYTFYPSLVVRPLGPEEDDSMVSTYNKLDGNRLIKFLIAAQIGLAEVPTNGSLIFVPPHYLNFAKLYKQYYETIFGYEAKIKQINGAQFLSDDLETDEDRFQDMILL